MLRALSLDPVAGPGLCSPWPAIPRRYRALPLLGRRSRDNRMPWGLRRSLSPMGWLVAAAWWTIPIGAAPFLLALMHGPSVTPALRSFLPRPPKFSLASRAVRLRIQRLARAAHFLALDFGRGCAFSALQMVKQRGSNVGRAVPFFEQALHELILPFVFAALERGADLV